MTRSELNQHQRHAVFTWAIAVLVLTLHYVFSYAPTYRLMRDWQGDLLPWGGYWWVYRPVDYLIDETPLNRPLMAWADVWEVRGEFEFAKSWRTCDLTEFEDAPLISLERQLILGECAVKRRVDSSGCESRPVTGRSDRKHLERFKEVTNWTEALLEKAPSGSQQACRP